MNNNGNNNHRRSVVHENGSVSDKIADKVVSALGSWRFIIIQSFIVFLWVVFNLLAISWRWDSYPFILLNLLFSTQAAYASPLILMAANRQAQKDRKRDEIEAIEVEDVLQIQRTQLGILQELHGLQNIQMDVLRELKDK